MTQDGRSFLATSCHQLGNLDKAKECYDEAVAWCDPPTRLWPFEDPQLTTLRAEADAVLNNK